MNNYDVINKYNDFGSKIEDMIISYFEVYLDINKDLYE